MSAVPWRSGGRGGRYRLCERGHDRGRLWPARYPLSCPMDSIIADAKADLASTVVFFCVLMGSVTLILALGLRTWITAPIVDENKKPAS